MIANTKNGKKKKIVMLRMNLFIQQYFSNANTRWELL